MQGRAIPKVCNEQSLIKGNRLKVCECSGLEHGGSEHGFWEEMGSSGLNPDSATFWPDSWGSNEN